MDGSVQVCFALAHSLLFLFISHVDGLMLSMKFSFYRQY